MFHPARTVGQVVQWRGPLKKALHELLRPQAQRHSHHELSPVINSYAKDPFR